MLTGLIFLALGLLFLWKGADFLVDGAKKVAENLNISPFVIALTVIAFGTSVPELVVAVLAAMQGQGDLTLGNVVGSNIANIGLVLGLTGILVSLKGGDNLVKKQFPFILAAPVVLFGLGFDGALSRMDGIILIVVAVVFHVLLIKQWREEKAQRKVEKVEKKHLYTKKRYVVHILKLIGGIAGVIVGAQLTVNGAVSIAEIFNVPELVIGLSIVAIGTSLPELVTSLVSAVRGEDGISLGNIAGSNILNIFVVLGIALIVAPIPIGRSALAFDIPVMLLFSLLLYLALLHYGRLRRREAVVLLSLYILYIVYSFIK